MTDKHGQAAPLACVENALLALCATGTALLLWWLLKYSNYGFEFTDESFYVVSMANPFIHDYSHTQFGFVYHPIYNLLGGDIVNLRQANIFTIFGLAWALAYLFLKPMASEVKNNHLTLLAVTAGLATSALIQLDAWLLTPSYNSLALQALLLTAIGMLLSDNSYRPASLTGWSLIGIGGWLAFMAKPSTALALALGVFLYLVFARKFSARLILISVAVSASLLLFSAMLIDGSILEFINRIKKAIEFGKILGSGHTLLHIFRIDSFHLTEKTIALIAMIFISVFASIYSVYSRKRILSLAGFLIATGFFSVTALATVGNIGLALDTGPFRSFLIFGLFFSAAAAGLTLGKFDRLKSIPAPQRAIACFFLATPYIYAFGTNGNYWSAGGAAAIFWLFSGLIFLTPLVRERASWLVLLPVAIATQAITVMLLQTGFEAPYRQPQAIKLNDTAVTFGAKKSTLVLPDSYAKYISSAVSAAKKKGFTPGTPVIDLSGQSPGLLYALGAESIGQAWNVGGYPGSLDLAKVALERTPCEKIAAAWVLLEPEGPRSISNELMSSIGSAFPDGYTRVADWETAAGAGGYTIPRHQELYKPDSPAEILDSCNKVRKKHQG
ncbi:hypothetical protein C0J09_05960 [Bordetella avium]|uniref:hypothetical protein n=1 Tax=Bordetella avium TaxID=521 RepID=UPI000FDAB836|nr:hypothetical protein [Bordetella avium]AZY48738.1 hypothetical protein C0J09_05960 [Bordetella avium]